MNLREDYGNHEQVWYTTTVTSSQFILSAFRIRINRISARNDPGPFLCYSDSWLYHLQYA